MKFFPLLVLSITILLVIFQCISSLFYQSLLNRNKERFLSPLSPVQYMFLYISYTLFLLISFFFPILIYSIYNDIISIKLNEFSLLIAEGLVTLILVLTPVFLAFIKDKLFFSLVFAIIGFTILFLVFQDLNTANILGGLAICTALISANYFVE